jgi:hypothetical protein
MNIYFTASLAAKDQYIANYKAIVDFLRSKNNEVICDHILDSTESKVRMSTREDRLKFHGRLEKWIKSCDFMIAETSFPSISVGYEISLALRLGKPVLVLYSEGDPPSLLADHENQKLVCEKYTAKTLGQQLLEFIEYIQGKNDTRFTFFITPTLASYLDDIAHKEKLPKSVYLRQLIEKDMREKEAADADED